MKKSGMRFILMAVLFAMVFSLIQTAAPAEAVEVKDGVYVTFYTGKVPKCKKDTVKVWIDVDGVKITEMKMIGERQMWWKHTYRGSYVLRFLKKGYHDTKKMRLVINKVPTSTAWHFKVHVFGYDKYGRKVTILPYTDYTLFKGDLQYKTWGMVY